MRRILFISASLAAALTLAPAAADARSLSLGGFQDDAAGFGQFQGAERPRGRTAGAVGYPGFAGDDRAVNGSLRGGYGRDYSRGFGYGVAGYGLGGLGAYDSESLNRCPGYERTFYPAPCGYEFGGFGY